MSQRILIVEDERRIASFVDRALQAEGFTPTTVDNGGDGLEAARSGEFDLVILDLGLPDLDGFAVLKELRKSDHQLPVVILTARDGVAEMVAGLDSGADDYVTKPFQLEELLARVRARLRGESEPDKTILTMGHVALDLKTKRAFLEGETVELTAREFAMAEMFFRNPDQVLSREQLLSHVWGYHYDPGSNIVDVYVGYLRRKLGEKTITTVRGLGYRLEGAARP
ncbi:MAG: response regulator transcription factor [Actinomycetota bacterium]